MAQGSEAAGHPDVARLKSQPLVKPLRVDARVMGEQLDQLATALLGFRKRPLNKLLADAAAAPTTGNPNVLDQGARGALRTQAGQDAKLKATDNDTALLRHDELNSCVVLDRIESCEVR